MIQLKTLLNCIDNSGASVVECIANIGMKRHARIGDKIIVVVQKQRAIGTDNGIQNSSAAQTSAQSAVKVRRGDIRHAVVVRTKKMYQRKDGATVRFDDNACVLISKAGDPIGSRINGVVGAELRTKGWSKILSLAAAHV